MTPRSKMRTRKELGIPDIKVKSKSRSQRRVMTFRSGANSGMEDSNPKSKATQSQAVTEPDVEGQPEVRSPRLQRGDSFDSDCKSSAPSRSSSASSVFSPSWCTEKCCEKTEPSRGPTFKIYTRPESVTLKDRWSTSWFPVVQATTVSRQITRTYSYLRMIAGCSPVQSIISEAFF